MDALAKAESGTYEPRLSELLESPRGAVSKHTSAHSHFDSPVTPKADGLSGSSRRWGDASLAVKQSVAEAVLSSAERHGYSLKEAAYVLGLIKVESGFNPDAAAQSTSASGLGQFIDKTGAAYGLTDKNRFDVEANIRALLAHTRENIQYAERVFPGQTDFDKFAYAYAIHHDGPSLKYGGLEIAQSRVIPWAKKFFEALSAGAR